MGGKLIFETSNSGLCYEDKFVSIHFMANYFIV